MNENREHPKTIDWVKPSFEEEAGEIERTAEALDLDVESLKKAFSEARLESLNSEDWSRMINSDSRDETWTLEEVKNWVSSREISGEDQSRDIERLISGFEAGQSIPAPIVLYRSNEPPYLIAGNTRLLLARVKGVTPKILALRI